ncbi:uncharacterized protein [Lepeophtheirus salmonis]|uniref:uncharacterized protein n=1 Tax=Lepeophtheirus salmonis TaxID=72036 RepID=UPI003AF3FAB2
MVLPHIYRSNARSSVLTTWLIFLHKDKWPSSLSDLNPSDFAVWGTFERETNRTSHPNVDSLKAVIVKDWTILSKKFIIKSYKDFRHRVEAGIATEGGHIEWTC